jgi:outer membrane immunogenic protein
VSFASMCLNYNNEVNDNYRKTSTQIGWRLGGGLEYGLVENLSVRTEYLYTDYGNTLRSCLEKH